jgi:hypothetical protein
MQPEFQAQRWVSWKRSNHSRNAPANSILPETELLKFLKAWDFQQNNPWFQDFRTTCFDQNTRWYRRQIDTSPL